MVNRCAAGSEALNTRRGRFADQIYNLTSRYMMYDELITPHTRKLV